MGFKRGRIEKIYWPSFFGGRVCFYGQDMDMSRVSHFWHVYLYCTVSGTASSFVLQQPRQSLNLLFPAL